MVTTVTVMAMTATAMTATISKPQRGDDLREERV